MPRLLSVNIGRPEPQAGTKSLTGIHKQGKAGPVEIGPLGVVGDAVLDRKHHGGPDQAVYLYFIDDYDWWAEELGTVLAPGTFGDNLTVDGVVGQAVAVGDRFAVGPVELEVTMHRTPCNTLGRHMGDPKFVKRFAKALRPGAYVRVVKPGSVQVGDAMVYTPFGGERLLLTELMALDGKRSVPADIMRRVLQTPVHPKLVAKYRERIGDDGAL